MFSGVFSFIGSAAFRWIFGEIFGYLKAKQEQEAELRMIRHQNWAEGESSKRKIAEYEAAAAVGIKIIEAQSAADAQRMAGNMLQSAIDGVNEAQKRTDWIGAFNALIRPELAQVAIILIVAQAIFPGYVTLTPFMLELFAGVLGVFVGGRISTKGG